MIKLEGLVAVVTFALWVFCLVDVISTAEGAIRNLSKTVWLIVVLLFPLVGSIAWLAAGRPEKATPRRSPYEREASSFPEYDRPGRMAASSEAADDEFLRRVRERAEEQRKKHQQRGQEGDAPA